MESELKLRFEGFLTITDVDTGEIVLDTKNAIHYGNMSLTVARALANMSTGHIHEMHFGNGAATASGTGGVTYFIPNTIGRDADLYNPTYYKVIDDVSTLNSDPTNNRIDVVMNTASDRYTDLVFTCTLNRDEPSGQEAFDTTTNISGTYVFNELGLKAYHSVAGTGLLLTHAVFSPVQKSLNRAFAIVYTIRVFMG